MYLSMNGRCSGTLPIVQKTLGNQNKENKLQRSTYIIHLSVVFQLFKLDTQRFRPRTNLFLSCLIEMLDLFQLFIEVREKLAVNLW